MKYKFVCGSIFVLLFCSLLALPSDCYPGGLKKRPENPRLLVLFDLKTGPVGEKDRLAIDAVYEGIVEVLTDNGYRIVDKTAAEQFAIQTAEIHEIDPLLNKSAAYGLKFHAEYTLYYRLSILTRTEDGNGALVKVKCQVIDNTAAQVITSKQAEASSTGLTLDDAVEKAGKTAGKKVVKPLMAAVEKEWARRADIGHVYTVVIEGTDDDRNLTLFQESFRDNPLVVSLREVESGGGKTTFEFTFKGTRDRLDGEIQKSSEKVGWFLKKIRAEGSRSTWKCN